MDAATGAVLMTKLLHELIRNDWLDHEFIDAHTNDFDQAAADLEAAVKRFKLEPYAII